MTTTPTTTTTTSRTTTTTRVPLHGPRRALCDPTCRYGHTAWLWRTSTHTQPPNNNNNMQNLTLTRINVYLYIPQAFWTRGVAYACPVFLRTWAFSPNVQRHARIPARYLTFSLSIPLYSCSLARGLATITRVDNPRQKKHQLPFIVENLPGENVPTRTGWAWVEIARCGKKKLGAKSLPQYACGCNDRLLGWSRAKKSIHTNERETKRTWFTYLHDRSIVSYDTSYSNWTIYRIT